MTAETEPFAVFLESRGGGEAEILFHCTNITMFFDLAILEAWSQDLVDLIFNNGSALQSLSHSGSNVALDVPLSRHIERPLPKIRDVELRVWYGMTSSRDPREF